MRKSSQVMIDRGDSGSTRKQGWCMGSTEKRLRSGLVSYLMSAILELRIHSPMVYILNDLVEILDVVPIDFINPPSPIPSPTGK